MNDPRGSIWRLWDLHYHTPSSFDVTDDISNEGIIDELVRRNIAAVAITDHHVLDVERIRILQTIAGDRLTIFPGIELRSELGGSESVHYIGIFSPEADLPHIWTKLQGKLSITPTDVAAKGGNDTIYVDFQDGSAVIHELGGVVSVHAGKKSNSIESISHATDYQRAVKVDLVEKCIDIFEAKDTSDANDYHTIVFHHGRTASYPAAPVQIPACGTTARGSSKLLALHSGRNNIILSLLLKSCGICVVSGVRKP